MQSKEAGDETESGGKTAEKVADVEIHQWEHTDVWGGRVYKTFSPTKMIPNMSLLTCLRV